MGTSQRTRWRWAGLLACVLVFSANSSAATERPGGRPDNVEPAVLKQFARGKEEATFWVLLRAKADLSPAFDIRRRDERGLFVFERLTEFADRTQAGLRALLSRRGVDFKPFWIANTIRVTGGENLMRELAARPEVERILADRVLRIPRPARGRPEDRILATEWNIDRIGAPAVWSTFGTRGEGIVVANIDTGAQFDHPALVRQYRGSIGGDTFDHNYNWFDPSLVCGNPSLAPCDNNGHGTHTMGTMVGDDGDPGVNQIGVAPHARWIAAKGCESNFCSFSALLASGQWVLAPTDLNGQNPRPDLRPHVVNNSWGGGGGDPFYRDTVNAWVASGIFPAFSNGNSGPTCSTSGSPGDYVNTYSAGAFDINDVIARFSSRGPSSFGPGELKPNLAAPGVNVRSSVPPSSYAAFSGTSMASPHVAGTVALIWSAAPSIERDIATTRSLLDQTATDVADTTCGGSAADNNVWGEGRLNALAAVEQAPRGPTGTLQGTVTDAATGAPLAGATVHIVGPITRTVATDASGRYNVRLPVGTYDVTASLFGYRPQTAPGVVVSDGQATVRDFALTAAPSQPVSGHVRSTDGSPVGNATVTILNTPIPPATTDGTGLYRFASVPEGSYDARAEAGRCHAPQTRPLVVGGSPVTLDFTLQPRTDPFGYRCELVSAPFIDANTVLPLSGDDASVQVGIPFPFPFYGQAHTVAHVSTNGLISFVGPTREFFNGAIPSTASPNGAIYAFWDDLFVDAQASVRTEIVGAAPNRQFVIEWRNVPFLFSPGRVRFEIVLHEDGRILTQYADIGADNLERGSSATVGLENQGGTVGFQYSFNEPSLSSGLGVLYRTDPNAAFVSGRVTDRNDGLALAGATVRALQNDVEVVRTTTASDGSYSLALAPGTYTVEASATHYGTESSDVVLERVGQVVVRDFALPTARLGVTPASLEFIQRAGLTRSRTLMVSNTGSASMSWEIRESSEAPWLSESPASGTVPEGGSQAINVTANSTGLSPGIYTVTLLLDSNSGRQPQVQVPVRLIVSAYDQPVNAGGGAFTDLAGETWVADQPFNGFFGFTRPSPTASTQAPISGTDDDGLFQDARVGRNDYRFEQLPAAGVYQVTLRFAEIQGRLPGQRVFDVFVEGEERQSMTLHDVSAEVGQNAADEHIFFIRVRDKLQIRLEQRTGEPILNAIRVTHRPDL